MSERASGVETFRSEREKSWRQLERLLGRLEAGDRPLTANELSELPRLYRTTLSSLSVARAYVMDRTLVAYLEALSLRAYLTIYAPRERLSGLMRAGALATFPRAVRALRAQMAAATLFMLVGACIGFALVRLEPSLFSGLVPDRLAGGRGPGAPHELMRNSLYDAPSVLAPLGTFTLELFAHNAAIALLAFGLGLAFGVPTILLLLYNGAILGAFVAAFHVQGLTVEFIGWLCVHGVTELLAIVIAAAGGLSIARGVLFPGARETRLDSARRQGLQAGLLAAGAVGMLVIAAVLEGVVRQVVTSDFARYCIGGLTAAFWWFYFAKRGLGGKSSPDD